MRQTSQLRGALLSLLAAGCSGPPPVAIITVSGTVEDAGGPVPGAQVLVNGGPVVGTDANGTFTVRNVAVPYQVLVGVDTPSPRALFYLGLTRPDPVLAFGSPPVPDYHTTDTTTGNGVGGLVGTPPWPTGTTGRVAFGSVEAHPFPGHAFKVDPTTAAYGPESVDWIGAATTSGGILHALQWTMDANSLPTSYTGYGNLPLDLTDGGTYLVENIALDPLGAASTTDVSGTVALNGYTLLNRQVSALFPPTSAQIPLAGESMFGLPEAFGYSVPSIIGVTTDIGFNLIATNLSAWSYTRQCAAPGPSASLSVPTASELQAPVDAAMVVGPGTRFSWSASLDGIHRVWLQPASSSGPELQVFTKGTSFSLPDLAQLGLSGLSWPAAVTYNWHVEAAEPHTIDSFATSMGWLDVFINLTVGCSGSYTISASRTFTTP